MLAASSLASPWNGAMVQEIWMMYSPIMVSVMNRNRPSEKRKIRMKVGGSLLLSMLVACCEPPFIDGPIHGTFEIKVELGIVASDNGGNSWDADQSGPDPMVCLGLPQGEFCTQPDADTELPKWNETTTLGEHYYNDIVEFDMRMLDQDDNGAPGDVICALHYSGKVADITYAYCCDKGMFNLLADIGVSRYGPTTSDPQNFWNECMAEGK